MATAKKPALKKKTAGRKAAPRKKPAPAQDKAAAFGVDAICAALIEGCTLTDLAGKIGIGIARLIAWIEADPERSARTREARTKAARLWDEKATQVIEEAKDGFGLAKAKELAHHYRWRASKVAPKEYGDKVQLGQAEDFQPLQVVVKRYGEA
jgi:hypothetical protein